MFSNGTISNGEWDCALGRRLQAKGNLKAYDPLHKALNWHLGRYCFYSCLRIFCKG